VLALGTAHQASFKAALVKTILLVEALCCSCPFQVLSPGENFLNMLIPVFNSPFPLLTRGGISQLKPTLLQAILCFHNRSLRTTPQFHF
jgi:hypothetical protein